ncbi:hypothetical protein CBR_g26167 [Chara braunii]|uniref:Uncharacterized protein n=1 Tax=Chara braunii TaxID=69332 RepID=A0A388L740_CHABU|nr:hypothetical protein CBR_g26167 [Chara braunii]|eukprot:GBG78130.1 hypothetical protein CBR_g26167 [Chara braunii]
MGSPMIQRSALGREAELGALYDVRKECFVDGNLFGEAGVNRSFVKGANAWQKQLFLSCEESYSGRLEKLRVEPDLQASVLSGLARLPAEYSEFLLAEKPSLMTGIYQLRSSKQWIDMERYSRKVRKLVSPEVLKSTIGTHFVSGILWGANTFVSVLNVECGSGVGDEAAAKAMDTWIRGQMELELHEAVSSESGGDDISGEGNYEEADSDGTLPRLTLQVYGDVFPLDGDGYSVSSRGNSSLGQAKVLIKRVQHLVRTSKSGHGKPLLYLLMPLAETAQQVLGAAGVPQSISFMQMGPEWVEKLTAFFDTMLSAKQAFAKFAEKVAASSDSEVVGAVQDRMKLMDIADRAIQYRVSKTLAAVRSGRVDTRFLQALLEELRAKGDIAPETVEAFIQRYSWALPTGLREEDHNKLEGQKKQEEEKVNQREEQKGEKAGEKQGEKGEEEEEKAEEKAEEKVEEKVNQESKEGETGVMDERAIDGGDIKRLWIKDMMDRGVHYVRVGEDEQATLRLRAELRNVDSCYLMVFAAAEWASQGETWQKNLALFERLMKEEQQQAAQQQQQQQLMAQQVFYMVEYQSLPPGIPIVVIERYMRGRRVSADVLAENSWFASHNLVSVMVGHETGCPIPHFSVPVKLQCPCSLQPDGSCSADVRQWQCIACQGALIYGRDDMFYCQCGRAEVNQFVFKCSDEVHGKEFVAFRAKDNLPSMVMRMAGKLEEINILLLGESGVGKSTFINAFANYLTYDHLAEAEKNDLIILIPTSFTLIDENYEERTVSVKPEYHNLKGVDVGNDNQNSNESEEVGASATQACKAYVFPFADKIVRLIDTPGIGDTRGVDQDKKNFENILAFLGFHREIHGICILLKPNNARLSVFFRYCIQQLMFHLHKNASANITFVFTNARSTFYRPGDTLPALKRMLNQIKVEPPHVDIPFNQKSTFCLDNESFRFMVALRNGIKFSEEDRQNFKASWDTSVNECKRLLQHVSSCKPHQVRDTISVNEARRLIALLSQPIGDIMQIIQVNLCELEKQRHKFESSAQEIEELQKELYIPVTKIAYVQLPAPRTVCASSKCPNAVKNDKKNAKQKGDQQRPVDVIESTDGKPSFVSYSICCEPCWLGSMQSHSFWQYVSQKAPAGLRFCSTFHKVSGNCKSCGCNWKHHAHQFTEAKQTTHKIVDTTVDGKIKTKEEARALLKEHVQKLRLRIKELEEEQQTINRIVASFAHFCVENAISPYNDAYKDYLDYLIKVKESQGSGASTIVEGLRKAKKAYEQQLKTLEEAIKSDVEEAGKVSPNHVTSMISDLYKLKHNGSMIKQTVEESKKAVDALHVTYSEVVYVKGMALVRTESEGPSTVQALQGWMDRR